MTSLDIDLRKWETAIDLRTWETDLRIWEKDIDLRYSLWYRNGTWIWGLNVDKSGRRSVSYIYMRMYIYIYISSRLQCSHEVDVAFFSCAIHTALTMLSFLLSVHFFSSLHHDNVHTDPTDILLDPFHDPLTRHMSPDPFHGSLTRHMSPDPFHGPLTRHVSWPCSWSIDQTHVTWPISWSINQTHDTWPFSWSTDQMHVTWPFPWLNYSDKCIKFSEL